MFFLAIADKWQKAGCMIGRPMLGGQFAARFPFKAGKQQTKRKSMTLLVNEVSYD